MNAPNCFGIHAPRCRKDTWNAIENNPPTRLSIRLFGAFEALHGGDPVPRTRSRKEQWLLAYLILNHLTAQDRDHLASMFWPDSEDEAALGNLRRSLKNLRHVLGADAYRITSPGLRTVGVDLTGASVDVLEFDAAPALTNEQAVEAALELRRGPLLEGCEEEWVFVERRAREDSCMDGLERLAANSLVGGDRGKAVRLLHRAVGMDPLRESAHCLLMKALASGGDFAAVDRQYRDLRLCLRNEINMEPAEETAALYRNLRSAGRRRMPAGNVAPDALPRRRLPCPLTRLIGRAAIIDEFSALLGTSRLVTLTGSGGVGKTRLAIAIADQTSTDYADGVWFVDLSPLTDPSLVSQAAASTLGVREQPSIALSDTLERYVQHRSLLLIFDNCEHVVVECARLVEALLAAGPGLRILVTSREALGLNGELALRVPSLAVPDESALILGPGSVIQHYESVQLFMDRASLSNPKFRLTAANLRPTAEICRNLDGIPLAIELAAARLRMMDVGKIASRLEHRFQLLSGGSRTAARRHQTLRAAIDWSYDLLTDAERHMLNRLSVFAGGCTLEAAEAVCSGDGILSVDVLEILSRLVDKSLVLTESDGSEVRYRLLETVRLYAQDRLKELPAGGALAERHTAFFLSLAEEAEPELQGPEQAVWLRRLERDHENLRAAQQKGNKGFALRIAGALYRFWDVRGYFSEGIALLTELLTEADSHVFAAARAKALRGAGVLARSHGDLAAAARFHAECLALYRELGDIQGIANALGNLGIVSNDQGEYAASRVLFEDSLSLQRELEDKQGIAWSLNNLGGVACRLGDASSARVHYEESLAILRELENTRGMSYVLYNIALIAQDQGEYTTARAVHEESLAIRRELGDKAGIAFSLNNLGDIASFQCDYAAARTLHSQSLALFLELGSKWGIATSLESLAALASEQGHSRRAAVLWGTAEALREDIGAPLPPSERPHHDHRVARVLRELSDKAFGDAWGKGHDFTLDQAVDFALNEQVTS